jgi:DNA mismatch repair protein MutS
MERLTPLRHQYLRIKQKYPGAIVFFRLGDFYETFDEDAKCAANELEITLTSREMGKGHRHPMAGIPHHALDSYLAKLIHRGYKVAICEQLSPPGQGLVAREVVRVITPGTLTEPSLLEGKTNNYLVSLIIDSASVGLAYVDISTGEFATTELPSAQLQAELDRLQPAEVIIPQNIDLSQITLTALTTQVDKNWFELEIAQQTLLDHFEVTILDGYGCGNLPLAIRAAGAILSYLGETQKSALTIISSLATYTTQNYMVLDAQTRRNLELFQGGRSANISLLSVIDLTQTPMGGRLLKRWLGQPLLDLAQLNQRQEAIQWFYSNTIARRKIISWLHQMADLERLANRVAMAQATPRELIALRNSLQMIPRLKEALNEATPLGWLIAQCQDCEDVVTVISQAIAEPAPSSLAEGEVIQKGFSSELDQLRSLSGNAKQYLTDLERRERGRTGIKSLKVGYNRVFGYYIEVSKPNLSQVPADYFRKQTLTGAERFYTLELKEYESAILNAQERIAELEATLFRQVCQQVAGSVAPILSTAEAIGQLDGFASLAEVAVGNNYVRPQLNNDDTIIIKGGRHPVVEQSLDGENFVPNDSYLSNKDNQLIILTGPNMSGKSTYLRQVALIVLLSQIGSFVPADSATIGLVDRIFTRIGAQEDIAAGQSTFMVEMVETANILNNATPRSLIILDEIGRGTSTYDGLSIAQAVAEYLHNHPKVGAKTLFATHYHELVELAHFLPRVKNFNIAVAEENGRVIFLRKIIPGGADKSYGIHVAQLAGLPKSVLHRAQEVLVGLESNHYPRTVQKGRKSPRVPEVPPQQIPLFGQKPPVVDELEKLDIDSLTPLEAINKLYELQKKAKEG